MHTHMNLPIPLRQFWLERAPRERQLLLAGAVFLAAVLLYLVAIQPAVSGVARLQRVLPQTRLQAAQLEALVTEAKSLRAQPSVAAAGQADARASLDASLLAAGLPTSNNAPIVNGEVRLVFTNVPFGKWAAWLAGAERTLGVHAAAVRLKAAAAAGAADIELTLRLPHA